MKKITLSILALVVSGSAFAGEEYTPGETTSRSSEAVTHTYTVEDLRADRNFVKNAFDFTLSSNVILTSEEDDTDARYIAVGTGNVNGRNIFAGHSNGGSVTSCKDPLTSEEAKESDAIADALEERFIVDNETACGTEA